MAAQIGFFGLLKSDCANINYITDAEEVVFLKAKDIRIYPNPAHDDVYVEFPPDFLLKGVKLNLVASDGKTVKRVPINANIQPIHFWGCYLEHIIFSSPVAMKLLLAQTGYCSPLNFNT